MHQHFRTASVFLFFAAEPDEKSVKNQYFPSIQAHRSSFFLPTVPAGSHSQFSLLPR
jgi:hypothetical protein